MQTYNQKIVYCATREKKFIPQIWSLMSEKGEGNNHTSKTIAICFTSGENKPLPMSAKFATRAEGECCNQTKL